jgi:hypothetical protein
MYLYICICICIHEYIYKNIHYLYTYIYRKCEPGRYCVDGSRILCDRGHWGGVYGLTAGNCSGLCRPGYYCPLGSASSQEIQCGDSNRYCPTGKCVYINECKCIYILILRIYIYIYIFQIYIYMLIHIYTDIYIYAYIDLFTIILKYTLGSFAPSPVALGYYSIGDTNSIESTRSNVVLAPIGS